jgi:hypothetical protein
MTNLVNSVSAQKVWEKLQIWPNGVAATREKAHLFVAKMVIFVYRLLTVRLFKDSQSRGQFMGLFIWLWGKLGMQCPHQWLIGLRYPLLRRYLQVIERPILASVEHGWW